MSDKNVYFFGDGEGDGDATQKNLLGGKGANLAEMTRIGLPVPAGFTITTEVCIHYSDNDGAYPEGLEAEVDEAIAKVEKVMGAEFGSTENPLLLSCRSGARESMPGMMDTVLNIGLNDTTVQALAKAANNEQFAWDSYRRFIQMYADVVMGMPHTASGDDPFEMILEAQREKAGVKVDSELSAEDLQQIVAEYKKAIKEALGTEFPTEAKAQLWGAIGAVFSSWTNDRAVVYRRMHGIPHEWGTATNVQAMAFGNLGDDCATGVALTRNCSNGEPGFCGDYLINAQGEDVVAGIRTPLLIEETLSEDMPEAYEQLVNIGKTLEQHYKDVQDIEFTIQRGKVWMLQTRNAKRTGFAAVRIAVDMVNEGLIDEKTALNSRRIPADSLNSLLQPVFDPKTKKAAQDDGRLLAKGINAGPGAATGQICMTAEKAEELYNADNDVQLILVRKETSPEDLRGMRVANGILTAFGGASSHAALVSRQMGKACIVGANDLAIDYAAGTVSVGDKVLKEGEFITIDGFTGEIFSGEIETSPSEVLAVLSGEMSESDSELYQRYAQLMEWVDAHRKLKVRANTEPGDDAESAVRLGCEGVGLCRTEHMFFEKVEAMREMILAGDDEDARKKALEQMLEYQREDFESLFRTMAGRPVTIRLLDPPLHEFLSDRHFEEDPKLAGELAKMTGLSESEIHNRVASLEESNPMLGHRGCRLGIVYPEVTGMQARAIFEAAVAVQKDGIDVHPEVMVPLVGYLTEFTNQEKVIRETAAAVFSEQGQEIEYTVGTMIEVPRAALCADQIAEKAEFFSFGTNDLTQTTLGMSRDDYGGFINDYQELDIIPADPFQTVDQEGVGRLMKLGVTGGRNSRPDLKIGICGEHGGDPKSVVFCHGIGLDYVSCSPRRIPIARLAAAQAALEEN